MIRPCGMERSFCNKITEQTTGRTFYPDVIYRHPFAEAEIVTQAVPYRGANETQDPENGAGARLYDMEAAAVYQAGAYYFGPHQMTFLKVVTDHGVAGDGKSDSRSRSDRRSQRRRRRSVRTLTACAGSQRKQRKNADAGRNRTKRRRISDV